MLGDVPVAGVLELDNAWPNIIPSKWITYFTVGPSTKRWPGCPTWAERRPSAPSTARTDGSTW